MAKKAEAASVAMRVVKIEVVLDQKTILIESWDNDDKHYRGRAAAGAGTNLLAAVSAKLSAAFPDQSTVDLLVDPQSFQILPKQ